MAGDNGQLHQQLVFNQCVQVKLTADGQQVFFSLVVQRFGGGFVGDKAKPAVYLQRHIDGAQAALAQQRLGGLHRQVQPRLGRLALYGAQFTAHLPIYSQIGV